MKNILILGTRGIPASYSGFETSVEETAVRFVEMGHRVTVYCRWHHYKEHPDEYKGVRLVHLGSINTKHLDTLTHTFNSVIHSLFAKPDAIILYGVGNGIFLPLYRLFGIKTIAVVDGADWERKKWGRFARFCLRMGRSIVVRFATHYVVDSEILIEQYTQRFKRPPVYIPYGTKTDINTDPGCLERHALTPRGYFVFVGRFVEEKGVDFLIQQFAKVQTDKKLVVIGGNKTNPEYEAYLKEIADDRVIFPGFVYGEEYEAIISNAFSYVSCSFLEGTSPSLLMAMAATGFVLVSDLPENLETLKGTCQTFRTGDADDFVEKISAMLRQPGNIEAARAGVKETVARYYDWDKISAQYMDLIISAS